MHRIDGPLSILSHGLLAQIQTFLFMFLKAGDNRIFTNTEDSENTGCTTFLCQKSETVLDRFTCVAVCANLTVKFDRSWFSCCNTEDVLQCFGTSASVQTGQTNNLTTANFERNITQQRVLCGQVFYFQSNITRFVCLWRELVCQLTTYHQSDDLIHCHFFCRFGSYPCTVSHDCDVIRNSEDLCHFMGDVDDTTSLISQHIYDFEQMFYLFFRQGRCRLVEHDNFRIKGNCFCNFYWLHLSDRKITQKSLRIKIHLNFFQPVCCIFIHLFMVNYL